MNVDGYEVRPVLEHFEVFRNGVFQFSADNLVEVFDELTRLEKNI